MTDVTLNDAETYAQVAALQRIEAKGIRREIRPFALRNLLDDAKLDRVIRCDGDGLSIRIDLEHMNDDHRRRAVVLLSGIVDQLRR